jgi:hypothetical protein
MRTCKLCNRTWQLDYSHGRPREYCFSCEPDSFRVVLYDRAWRASIGAGVPADALRGMSYAEAAQSLELDGVGYQPRASVVADAFEAPGSLVFHPLTGEVDEL